MGDEKNKSWEKIFEQLKQEVKDEIREVIEEQKEKLPGDASDPWIRRKCEEVLDKYRKVLLENAEWEDKDELTLTEDIKPHPFKGEVLQLFRRTKSNYKKDFIDNFMKYDLPRFKQYHVRRAEEKGIEAYGKDMELLDEGSERETLRVIASEKVIRELRGEIREKYITRKQLTDTSKKDNKTKGASVTKVAHLIRWLYLEHDLFTVSKKTLNNKMIDLIHFIVGGSRDYVKKRLSHAKKIYKEPEKMSEQDKKDGKKVAKLFQDIEEQEIADKIIKQLSLEMDS